MRSDGERAPNALVLKDKNATALTLLATRSLCDMFKDTERGLLYMGPELSALLDSGSAPLLSSVETVMPAATSFLESPIVRPVTVTMIV
jgi:hypothetical protein